MAPNSKVQQRYSEEQLGLGARIPRHIAIIMDGNGRWAKRRLLPRVEGHRQGAKTVRMVCEECRRLGIRYLTLYAFSSENWNRPADEVSALMKLFQHYLESEVRTLIENGIRLRAIGDRSKLPGFVRESLERVESESAANEGMDLILAISYGARDEILRAATLLAREVAEGLRSPESINEEVFASKLYAPDVPDPDLLIRTSDENRISNFLLWQLAYSEIVVSPLFWPEFSKDEFFRCLREFGGRIRRFGKTDEQLRGETEGGGRVV